MSNRIEHLLEIWSKDEQNLDWILATVIETAGSSYRKSGAMMLINSLGQYYGLISGGCLESDLMRQAKQCFEAGFSQVVCYDMREEDDIAWQLGIGCGGMVKILLQPINEHNDYLNLPQLQANLENGITSYYSQNYDKGSNRNELVAEPRLATLAGQFYQTISPAPTLLIIGGGVDARPLCEMANQLGWRVIVADERVNYARPAYFPSAKVICKNPIAELNQQPWFSRVNGIAIMTHNVSLDGLALKVSQMSNANYIGLLGPTHRTERVLTSISMSYSDLTKPLSNPIGVPIGGELPEAIALSILAEIQGVLEQKIDVNTEFAVNV